MQPQSSNETYQVPQMSQADVDARFEQIVADNPEIAEIERRVVAAYDQNPAAYTRESIGGAVVDATRTEASPIQPDVLISPSEHEPRVRLELSRRASVEITQLRHKLGA